MSFVKTFNQLDRVQSPALARFASLIAQDSPVSLESLAHQARAATLKYFGKTIRLFAPLYVSNECVNNCSYCGFSRDNPILRVTLAPEQVVAEARHLVAEGFRDLLIVSGEHPKFVSVDYLADVVGRLHEFVPAVSIEVGPMERDEYIPIVQAGAEGLVVYQETYDREVYGRVHTAGPKKDFDWRLETAERGYAAGFRRLGVGALLGLADWRNEAISVAAHCDYLLRHCWKARVTVAFPRLRPAAGGFHPTHPVDDRDFVRLLCAMRVVFPHVGIVLSTREPRHLRDGLVPLGVTAMSAGAKTEPGGYTGAGKERVHLTVAGRAQEEGCDQSVQSAKPFEEDSSLTPAEEQFRISDTRSASEMALHLRSMGYEAVWKDWDTSLSS
ncbi:radical SAM protein [Kamptonema cortianum]|nr:radical SAM protein [Kamptonema cortianum]MDL5050081.1 radical SAM protein [Oscillatoria amoena NRMC-F 0135]